MSVEKESDGHERFIELLDLERELSDAEEVELLRFRIKLDCIDDARLLELALTEQARQREEKGRETPEMRKIITILSLRVRGNLSVPLEDVFDLCGLEDFESRLDAEQQRKRESFRRLREDVRRRGVS